MECSRCHGRTRVSYEEFAQHHLPYWMWTPWRRYSRYMTLSRVRAARVDLGPVVRVAG